MIFGLLKSDTPKLGKENSIAQTHQADDKEYKIFNFGTEIKNFADVRATIEKEGYKSGNYDDLLDYDSLHSKDPYKNTIYACGKSVITPRGPFYVYSVSRDGPRRNLELHDEDGLNAPWIAHGFEFMFLGVKKR